MAQTSIRIKTDIKDIYQRIVIQSQPNSIQGEHCLEVTVIHCNDKWDPVGESLQYVKLDTFKLDGYKKSNPDHSAESIRLEIAYFQCTMMSTLIHDNRQKELSSHLANSLMEEDTIQESFDLVKSDDPTYLDMLESTINNGEITS